MKKLLVLVVLTAAATGVMAALVAGADDGKNALRWGGEGAVTYAVYGDAPYGTTPTDTSETDATPAFISAVNGDHRVKAVVHVGDIHSGKQFCTYGYDQQIFGLWSQYQNPLVYTPGDNEWTDCHKSGEGGNVQAGGSYVDYANGDPVANLALVRQLFFAQPGRTLGQHDQQVVSQGQAFDPSHPEDAQYIENVMWEQSNVLFVTVNLPGGSNNDADIWYGAGSATGEQLQEAAQRTAADLRWLDAAFGQAKADHVAGVVVFEQADMWDLDGKASAHIANYKQFIDDIASNTLSLGEPVLLFNGDSHVYRSDNPLVDNSACQTESGSGTSTVTCADDAFDNQSSNAPALPAGDYSKLFHRVVVHGSTFPLEYLRLTIDPKHPAPAGPNSFGPFSWERVQP